MAAKTEILDAMADQIREALAGADWDFQVEPRLVLSPTTPSIDLYPGGSTTEQDVAGMGDAVNDIGEGYIVNVRARIAPNDHEAGQEVLLVLSDPEDDLCLVQALYDDATLGGIVYDLHLLSESAFTVFTDIDPSKAYLGILWRFLVVPAHS